LHIRAEYWRFLRTNAWLDRHPRKGELAAMSDLLKRLDRATVTPEISRPDPNKVTGGDPVHTTWNMEDRDGLYCGIWQSTPGAWRVSYDEWEYCRILEGHSIITGDDGSVLDVKAGDSFMIRPGFSGVWDVFETTCKEYVIRV
jgi:uncharacterized protein